MSLLLDTSILIGIEKGDRNLLKKLKELRKLYPNSPEITCVTYFEYLVGLKIRKPKRIQENLHFLKRFITLHTTDSSSEILADLKIKYDKKGVGLPLADLMSASIAIDNGLVFVTLDTDFERIEELKKIIL